MDSLPRYNISIDPEHSEDGQDLGMTAIAYTANPAIIQRGMAFNKVAKMQFADQLKGRLAAPILIPDLPIYREDDELGAYEVVFTKETIEALYDKFMANGDNDIFNLDHNNQMKAPAFIREIWVTGPSESDPSYTKYGIELPEGSVFVVSQFTDLEYFKKEIIEKDRLGYSIEGFLGLALSKIKQQLTANKMKQNFTIVPLANSSIAWVEGEIAVDNYLYRNEPSIILIDGKKSEAKYPIWEANVELADGRILQLDNGKILKIEEKVKLETMKQKFEKTILADGTALFISKMEVDGEVFVIDENGDKAPIFDGEHKLDNGSAIVTVGGKITEIKPKAEEVAMAEEPVVEEVVTEEAPAPMAGMDEAAVLAIVQPKLDELYKVIAEMKTLIESGEVKDVVKEEVFNAKGSELKFRHYFKSE